MENQLIKQKTRNKLTSGNVTLPFCFKGKCLVNFFNRVGWLKQFTSLVTFLFLLKFLIKF